MTLSRFRKPNFELISVYAVQNPFLYGMYELRREQLKMQQDRLKASDGLKERQFFYPVAFEALEAVIRNNFNTVPNLDQDGGPYPLERHQEVKLYSSSLLANQAYKGCNRAISQPRFSSRKSIRGQIFLLTLCIGLHARQIPGF